MTSQLGRQPTTPTAGREDAGATSAPGYLYVELRDLAGQIKHDDVHRAAATLFKFGDLIRNLVASHRGSEIRAQGDSYLCICATAATAVDLALAILSAATASGEGEALAVSCGVVAKAGLRTAEGYAQAARLGGAAPVGSLLITEEVRELTPELRGTYRRARELEGVTKSGARLWLVTMPMAAVKLAPAAPRRHTLRFAAIGFGAVLLAILAIGGFWLLQRGGGHLPPGPWTIAAQIPLSGPRADLGATLQNAAQLAVDETNAQGGIGGQQLVLDVLDEGTSDTSDLASSAIDSFIADNSVVAVVGPLQSPHGLVDVPATNAAGLLQCSPGNTNPGLTKPRFGALDLRSAHPDRINYVRVSPSDDIQGPAAASFVYHASTTGIPQAGIRDVKGLGIHQVLAVDDTTPGGRATADSFESSFQALGGTTVRRAMNPGTTDFSSILGPLDDSSGGPWAVYFGGIGDGGAVLKQAMVAAGRSDVPLVSWDGLFDGSGSDAGSYINLAGADAANSYVTQASIAPAKADFTQSYREAFGADPNPYAATTYACAQIVVDALQAAARNGVDAAGLRDAVRSYAANPANSFDTAVGSVSFDANGDSMSQYATFYAVDTGANGGQGDWVYLDQQDFGPPT